VSRSRQLYEFGGFAALSWQEMEAWARMTRIRPELWEIDTLLRLDGVWRSVMAEKGHPFEEIEDDARRR
jgi:hypothetical protein